MIVKNALAYNTVVLNTTVKSFIVHATRREHQGRLSTIDLLVHVACFAKKKMIFSELKAASLN